MEEQDFRETLKKVYENYVLDLEENLRMVYNKSQESIISQMEKENKEIKSKMLSEVNEWKSKYEDMCDICIMVESDNQEIEESKNRIIEELEDLIDSKKIKSQSTISELEDRIKVLQESLLSFDIQKQEADQNYQKEINDLETMNRKSEESIREDYESILRTMKSEISKTMTDKFELQLKEKEEEHQRILRKNLQMGKKIVSKLRKDHQKQLKDKEDEFRSRNERNMKEQESQHEIQIHRKNQELSDLQTRFDEMMNSRNILEEQYNLLKFENETLKEAKQHQGEKYGIIKKY